VSIFISLPNNYYTKVREIICILLKNSKVKRSPLSGYIVVVKISLKKAVYNNCSSKVNSIIWCFIKNATIIRQINKKRT
jgi:hypothetical protein